MKSCIACPWLSHIMGCIILLVTNDLNCSQNIKAAFDPHCRLHNTELVLPGAVTQWHCQCCIHSVWYQILNPSSALT